MSEHIWDDDELYDLDRRAPEGEDDPVMPAVATPASGVSASREAGDGATPFVAGHGFARRFPTSCLPPKMRDYVHDIATRAQVPVDLPALIMLGMIGAAAAPRMMVRASVEWTEPTSLYVMCALNSSAGKSPAVNELKRGTWRADKVLQERHVVNTARLIRQLTDEAEQMEIRLNHEKASIQLEEKAGIESQIKAKRAEVLRLSSTPPPAPRLTLDGDTTPEALSDKLAAMGGQGAIIDDEGTLLANLGGQYSGGRTGNLGIFLKGYDCDAYRPSRVTRDAAPIERVALGLVLAPQPAFVADMMRNPAMQNSGFVNRFLVAMPGDLLGQRLNRKSTFVDDLPVESRDRSLIVWWETLLESIVSEDVIDSHHDLENVAVIDLTREAYELLNAYMEEFEPRLRAGRGNLSKVANWAGKHVARVLRLSAGLHIAAGKTSDDRVSKDVMADAIALGEWAIEHFTGMGKVVGLTTGAAQIKEYIDGIPSGWCTRTDINNKVFNRKGKSDDLTAWIDELVATGEYVTDKLSNGKGRPVGIVGRADAVVEREN